MLPSLQVKGWKLALEVHMRNKTVSRLRKVFRYVQGKDPWLSELLENRIPNTNISLESIILKLRGKEIWRQCVPLDWVIHCNELWSRDALIIGGHLGDSSSKLMTKVAKLQKIHIYEPIPDFFGKLCNRFAGQPNVKVFNLAITNLQGPITMKVCGDSTLASQTGRALPRDASTEREELVCQGVTLSDALLEFKNIGETSILMNCEGSEYAILDSIKSLPVKPFSIFFQTHTTDSNSFERLYKARAEISHFYLPIVCEDWAWDVWLRKDASPLSALEIERFNQKD